MNTHKWNGRIFRFVTRSLILMQALSAAQVSGQAQQFSYIPLVTRTLGYRESSGVLDSSFGEGGIVLTPLEGFYDREHSLALQPDGKIVAVGPSALLRYQPDGSLDASFGGDGIVQLEINPNFIGQAVALQLDGKILVAGYRYSQEFEPEFALARYHPDGSLDTSFGTEGIVITDFGGPADSANAIVIQPDGKIILGGTMDDPYNYKDKDFALARYNTDGSLDNVFGSNGMVTLDFHGQWDSGEALALQPDGKILMAGSAGDCPYACFALARFNPDGSLDTSFAGTGWVTADIGFENDYIGSMALQPDGKIVVAGTTTLTQGDYPSFALVRYHPDGVLDLGLGMDGKLITDWGAISLLTALTIQRNGKMIAVGRVSYWTKDGFGLVRYLPDGRFDSTFGSGGMLITDLTEESEIPYAVVLQADGRILVGGTAYNESGYYFALVRYK